MSVIGLAIQQLRHVAVASPGLHGFFRSETETGLVPIELGHPGRCPKHDTLLIAVFDDSGSLSGPAGADPVSNRYAEAEAAVAAIARSCRCGRELVSILHFDSPSTGDVPPISLQKRNRAAISKGLRAPSGAAGSSVLWPSLKSAHGLAKTHPAHQTTLVVFTDFELFDDDLFTTVSRLNNFPGDVHVVVLRGQIPDNLLDERITVTRVDGTDPRGAVAVALFDSLTQHRRK